MPDVNTHHQCGDGDSFDFIMCVSHHTRRNQHVSSHVVRWKASPSGGSDKQQQDGGGGMINHMTQRAQG